MKNKPRNALLWPYYRRVWAKARELETGHWVRRVFGDVVPAIAGAAMMVWILGLSEAVEGERFGFALLGLALLAIGVARFAGCLVQAPALLDAESRSQIAGLNAEIAETRRADARLKEQLAALCLTGLSLISEQVRTELELNGWKYRFSEFATKIDHLFELNFGSDARVMMVASRRHRITPMNGSFNEEHNELRCRIDGGYIPLLQEVYERPPNRLGEPPQTNPPSTKAEA